MGSGCLGGIALSTLSSIIDDLCVQSLHCSTQRVVASHLQSQQGPIAYSGSLTYHHGHKCGPNLAAWEDQLDNHTQLILSVRDLVNFHGGLQLHRSGG